jgi:hypothetical protein
MHAFAAVSLAACALTQVVGAQKPASPSDLVVKMSPCKVQRSLQMFYVLSSKTLIRQGHVDVDGESFAIYLPREKKNHYSVVPRPKRQTTLASLSSTCLAVDQNHDGKLDNMESYFAEFPLRIGDTMFDVVAIGENGDTITLRRSASKLTGAVIGRLASEFAFETIDGRVLRRADFANKALVIDCWAPS